MGCEENFFKWITDWTKDRKQRVVLNGAESEWLEVISSVVHGSVLGLILFLDLKLQEKAPGTCISLFKFADDSKIGQCVRDKKDEEKFQNGIDAIHGVMKMVCLSIQTNALS